MISVGLVGYTEWDTTKHSFFEQYVSQHKKASLKKECLVVSHAVRYDQIKL